MGYCMQPIELLLGNNSLTGPTFPSAWLQPGSMHRLETLHLLGNPGLQGTLPANLSWPLLWIL